jgi:L-malate glycosyltransferase
MNSSRAHVLFLIEGTSGPASHDEIYWARFIRYCHPAIRLLNECGFRVTLASLRERSPLHSLVEDEGGSTLSLGATHRLTYPRTVLRLARYVGQNRVDVVHAHEPISSSLAATAVRIARQGATIYHRHHTLHADGQQKYFSRVAGRLSHMTLAVSRSAAASAAASDHTPIDKIRMVYNGIADHRAVPPAEILGIRDRFSIPDDALVVLVIGQLNPGKGHSTLLAATELLGKRIQRRIDLLIVGTGVEEAHLRHQAGSLKAVHAHFAGQQSDVAPWYAAADIVSVPSFREAFGLVAIEAMASARPTIASNVGGLAEIVTEGVDGLLVPAGDPEGLAAALSKVATSPELAARLSTSARNTYERRFSLDAMVTGWVNVYETTMRSSRSSHSEKPITSPYDD